MNIFTFGKGNRDLVILPGAALKSLMPSGKAVEGAYSPFTDGYTVYLMECGDEIKKGTTARELAREAACEMDRLGITEADVFGCSLGGMIAQYIAVDRPDLVRRLALGSTLAANTEESSAILERWRDLADAGDPSALNREVFSRVYSTDYYEKYADVFESMIPSGTEKEMKRFSAMMDACLGMDIRGEAEKIKCPVLAMGSWDDRTLPPEGCVEIARLTGGELYMFSGYGHAVYDEAPDYKPRLFGFFSGDGCGSQRGTER